MGFDQVPALAPAAAAHQIEAPAAGHAELFAPEPMRAEGAQNGLHLAAQVGVHPHSALVQFAQKRLGQRTAQQHVHVEFRHAARQSVRRERAENKFPAAHFRSVPPRHDQQPHGRIEHRRHAALTIGNCN